MTGQPVEKYRYRELTIADGLPDPSVSRIIQDKSGYVWLATLNGIARYDGNRIRNYHPSKEMDPEASNRDFPYLHVSDSESLWVGYLFGKHALFRYDQSRDSFLYINPFLGTHYADSLISVRSILEDRGKHLWVATGKDGVFKVDFLDRSADTLSYRHYRAEATDDNSLPTQFMAPGLWQDLLGTIWLLSEAGLVEYRALTDDFITYQWSDVPLENEGIMFTPDTSRNCLWIASFNGLVRFDLLTKQTKRYQFVPGAAVENSPNFIPEVNLDLSGRLWVTRGGYPNSTLWTFDPEYESFHPAYADELNKCEQLPGALDQYTDYNGIVWSGNFRRGVQAINPVAANIRRVSLATAFEDKQDFDESGILAMAAYSSNKIFIGTQAQGVWCWDHKEETLARVEIQGIDKTTDSIRVNDLVLADELDLLWVITPTEIYEYHIPTGRSKPLNVLRGREGKENYQRACYWGGWLWGGSLGQGAYRLKAEEPGEVQHFSLNQKDSLAIRLPYGGLSDIQAGVVPGQFWLSSVYGGLMEWLPRSKEFYLHPTQRDIRYVLPTTDSLLWLVSFGEVKLYDPQTKEYILLPPDTRTALSHPLSVAHDGNGTLWFVTEESIVAVDEKEHSVSHRFASSTWLKNKRDWKTGSTNLAVSDGRVYVANLTGLFVIDPSDIKYDAVPPLVTLQSFAVNGRKKPLPLRPTEEISFAEDSNHLNFTLAVLHFLSPEGNQFNYFLEGFDTEWHTAKPTTVLAFHDLEPGRYRLLVSGISSDGTTGPVQEMINIRIGSRWYAGNLAYIVYLLIFLCIGYGWFWVVTGRKEQELEAPEQLIKKTKKEHAFIALARGVVLENLAEPEFGPDQMAETLSISRSQLHRRLDKLVGMSTTHFINATRLAVAKEKLADPTFTIAEIAYACGYNDPSYFARKFRELYGLSPSEYRKKS